MREIAAKLPEEAYIEFSLCEAGISISGRSRQVSSTPTSVVDVVDLDVNTPQARQLRSKPERRFFRRSVVDVVLREGGLERKGATRAR